MTEETSLSPAIERTLLVPPQLVEAVQEDPSLLVELSRAQLLVVQDIMVKRLIENPDMSTSAIVAVHGQLSKNAQLDPKGDAAARGTGFSVVINLGAPAQPQAIEVKAERVEG